MRVCHGVSVNKQEAAIHSSTQGLATGYARRRQAPTPTDVQQTLDRLHTLADLLDRQFRIPGTGIRFGLDSIVGLLPVVGDTATALVGAYPVVEGVRLGVRKRIVSRMLLNLGVDWLIGLVPVADLVLDVAFKANVRNVRLLESELRRHADVVE